ncbi:MAG: hypothetical protein ACLQE9_19790 [Roseiarcus sp.]
MCDDQQNGLPKIMMRSLLRLCSAIGRRARAGWGAVVRTSKDPYLPLIILGVVAAAFGFAFIFDVPPMVVFGVLVIGCLTAFIETKLHKENGGR